MKKKIDVNEFWDKRELKQSWGKVILSILLVCFTLFYGAYCLDLYMGAHNLTFVKFKINPEFGFIVNGNDEVVHYISLNDDARKIFKLDMFKGKKTEEAVDKAVEVAKENNFLVDENKTIEVTVVSKENNDKKIVEDKIVNVIKKKDETVVAEVVEATEEEKEMFTDIKLDNITKVEETIKRKEELKKVCNYTTVTSEDMSGKDRTLTAINVSKKMYPSGSKNVVIINGEDLIQGILSNSIASALDAPILYVNKDVIRDDVKEELTRLNPKNVYILGGSANVSDNVLNTIKTEYGIEVTRVAGADRFLTSIDIAKKVEESKTVTSVIIAPSENEPVDAAMLSSISGKENMPILYTKRDSLVPSVKEYIMTNKSINTIYIAGGLIKDNVLTELKNLDRSVERISGADRFITNVNAINKFEDEFRSVVVVNNLVDTVLAARFSVKNDHVLFYMKDSLNNEQIKLIKNNNKNTSINKIFYFGGTEGKISFRNMLFNVKKVNMSKCENITEELLFQDKKAVFYIPHQDDESSYLGQPIIRAIDNLGAENVYLVVMTKGNSSAIYIKDAPIPKDKDTSLGENRSYLNEPVNNKMLKDYGYVDANGNASFMMARDAEFRKSAKALGVPESNYIFIEDLVGKEGLTHKDRFDDKGVAKNMSSVKNIMKYYDKLFNHDVTHITYTFLDSHTDHNSLGKALTELHFDHTLSDKEFENVYLVAKYRENHVINENYLVNLKNIKDTSRQFASFDAYKMNKEEKIIGIGFRSASHVYDEFTEKINNNTLENVIHIPYKK